MKKNCILFICIFFISIFCFSQKETEKWYFPGPHIPNPSPAINFSSGVPVYVNNSGMGAGTNESSATISDVNGNLLFYVDGNRNIYNRNHVVMTNGNNVFMGNSMTQGSIFVPKPGSPTIMYLFHIGLPMVGAAGPFNLYYTEIDMTLSGGLGAVNANKNILIPGSTGNCGEKMTVTKHCNGTDYWLLVHNFTGTIFKAYQISSTGIVAPVVSSIGSNHVANLPPGDDTYGQMKFSPNGTKLGVAMFYSGSVDCFDFNKLTGVISNHINLGNTGVNTYGLEFSPDNTKLYVSDGDLSSKLMQWDLCAGNSAAIINSKQTFNVAGGRLHALQLAPNNKIYGTLFNTSNLSVINNPNVAGVGCGFVVNGFSVAPSTCYLGLPNFITSYFDKPGTYSNVSVAQVNTTNCLNNGIATATLCNVFGAAPYTYTWSNNTVDGPTNNLSSTISNLAPGSYNVIVSDATCMKDTITFTIAGSMAIQVNQNPVICSGTSFTLPDGSNASISGTYIDTLQSQTGCDSIITTNLMVITSFNDTVSPVICFGNTYNLPNGSSTSIAGTYIDTVQSTGGCDSIVTTILTINPVITFQQSATICSGNSFVLPGGNTVSAAGNYTDTLTTGLGCDSVITTSLIVTAPIAFIQNVGICNGSSYTLPGGNSVSVAGTYIDSILTSGGCDSIVTTILAVLPSINVTQNPILCLGNSFTLPDGTTVSTQGTYIDTLLAQGGCDSIITTNLVVKPNSSYSQTQTICSNQSFTLPDGTIANTSGTYTSTITAANGCDSIITTTLNVNAAPSASVSADITILQGSTTTLVASGGGAYNWIPSLGLNNTNSSTVIASPDQTTMYCVIITAGNACSDTACVTVSVETPCPETENLSLPNAFSPNGDNANDEYCLLGWEKCLENFNIVVFDRWGEKVFESKDPNFCWDGRYKSEVLDAQVLIYYVVAKYHNFSKPLKKTGNISLIR